MLASHCSEIDTRWPYEYGILNFARRWPRTWSTAIERGKQVQCLHKVIRWHPNHTRRQHEDVNFYSSLYPQDTRRLHDVVLRVRCVRTRLRRRHVTFRWYTTFGRPWEIQLLIGDYWKQNTQYISTLFQIQFNFNMPPKAGRGRGKKKLAGKYRTHSGSGPPSPSGCCQWLDISV